MFKLEVGQTVYLAPQGNAARGWDEVPIEGVVTSIGRKYYLIQASYRWGEVKIEKITGKYYDNKSNSGFVAYESLVEFTQSRERVRLIREIRSAFDFANTGAKLSYSALKQIHEIINNPASLDPRIPRA